MKRFIKKTVGAAGGGIAGALAGIIGGFINGAQWGISWGLVFGIIGAFMGHNFFQVLISCILWGGLVGAVLGTSSCLSAVQWAAASGVLIHEDLRREA